MTIRDEVALIIDPESIKGRESYAALPGFVSPEAAQKAADYQFGEAIKEAYAKADAILALSPPEPTEGQVEIAALAICKTEGEDFELCSLETMRKCACLLQARAALIAARSMPLQDHGWQPIETAPKDEVIHMGWWKTWPPNWPDQPRWNQEIGTYCCTRGGWRHSQATHWKPVAAPPAAPAILAEQGTK